MFGAGGLLSRRRFLRCLGAAAVAGTYSWVHTGVAAALPAQIPVLCYHRIGNQPYDLAISAPRFEADLNLLAAQGYSTITLEQFRKYMREERVDLPERPVLITFDDGYDDNYEKAFPILRAYNMTAAFFIISGYIGLPDRMTMSQIYEMQNRGMSFGSHTVNHFPLAELSELDVARELRESKQALEEILDIPIDSIAYPKGSYDTRTIRIAEQLGYREAFTTRYGGANHNWPDYELLRLPMFKYDRDAVSVIRKHT